MSANLRRAAITIVGILAYASAALAGQVVFTETFDSGRLSPPWAVSGTGQYRVQVTNTYTPHGGGFHLLMDDRISDNVYSRVELTLRLDLTGYTNGVLQFWIKGFNEDSHGPPYSPFGSADFDGVAVSTNGTSWQEVQTWRNLSNEYVYVSAPLDPALRARGWSYTSNFFIRFYQYDNQPIPGDGIALDDITVTANRPPVAEHRTVTVPEDSQTVIELPGTDPEGAPLMGTILGLPESGKLYSMNNGVVGDAITNVPTILSSGHSVLYAASPHRWGLNVARFEFRLSDGGALSGTGTVTVDITAVNDPPSTEPDWVSTPPGRAVRIDPLGNDWDRDGDGMELIWMGSAGRGTVSQYLDGGLLYTPHFDFERGLDQFAYTIRDPAGLMTTGTVTVAVGYLQGGDWRTFANGPGHTGYYPGRMENERFMATWSIPYSNSATLGINEMVIGEGLVIFTEIYQTASGQASNYVTAVDLDNGRMVWSQPLPMSYFYPPTYDQGRVYVVQDTPHVIWCLSARTGELIWTNHLASVPAANFAPTVAGDGVWFRTAQGRAIAGFDTNGTFRFETHVGGYSWDPYWTASYYQDVLYCWNLTDFTGLHPQTGEILWQVPVKQYGATFVSIAPAVAEGHAFLNGRETLAAVNLSTRAAIWTNEGAFIGTPAAHQGIVYITSTNSVQAFRSSDGVLLREYGPMTDETHIYSSRSLCPIVTDDLLISSFHSNTYVFNRASGSLIQTLPVSGHLVLANGTLVISTAEAKLRAFTLPVKSDVIVTSEATNKATIWNPLTQTFAVRNPGPAPATDVRLAYQISSMSILRSIVPSQGSCQQLDDEVICDLGTIASGALATVTFDVVPTGLGWLAGGVSVTLSSFDANPDNNVAGVSTEIGLPTLSVTGFSVSEGDSGTTASGVQLSLSATSAVPVVVTYGTAGYSAEAGKDFVSNEGTIIFPPGSQEQFVPISIIGDTEFELDEQFYLGISPVTNVAGYFSIIFCTILNDDPAPVVSIDSVSLAERNVGRRDIVFALSLSKTSRLDTSVFLQTSNLTAEGGIDYGTNQLWLWFPPGSKSLSFAVPIYGDVAIEPNETFAVVLTSARNAKVGNGVGIGTILNDDGLPGQIDHFSFGTLPTVAYAGRPLPVTLTGLDAGSSVANTFNGQPAIRALLEESSVVVAEGTTNELSPLPFAPLQDNAAGYLHCELLYLASELKGPRRLTALEFLSEQDLPNNLTIRLQHTPGSSFQMLGWTQWGWTTVLATNNLWRGSRLIQFQTPFDYNGVDNLLVEFDWKADFNWASTRPGRDTKQLRALFWYSQASYHGIPVGAPSATSILPTLRFHGETAAIVTPSKPRFTNGIWSGDLLVPEPLGRMAFQLDDGDGHVSVSSPVTTEPLEDLSIQIERPQIISTNTPFTYTLVISNTGPATSTGIVITNTVASNLQIVSVVPSRGGCIQSGSNISCSMDEIPAGSTESVSVEVRPTDTSMVWIVGSVARIESEAYVRNNSVAATITQPPRLSVSGTFATEGSSINYSYIYFDLRLSPPSAIPVSVACHTEDVSAGSEHNDPNKDYQATYSIITFNPGETHKQFRVELGRDVTIESNETFRVRLQHPINGVIQDETAVGTIVNDDFPVVSVASASTPEPDDGVTNAAFSATLSQPVPFPVSVSFRAGADSATAGLDFVATNGLITFPPGETNQIIWVPLLGDRIDESDERFFFVLQSPATNAAWTVAQTAGVIVDNDPTPTLSINSPSVAEGNLGYTNLAFLLSLSHPSSRLIEVSYATADSSAVVNQDYLTASGRSSFPPGMTNLAVSVFVIGDTQAENHEQLALYLSNITNAVLGTNLAAGTIITDDGLPGDADGDGMPDDWETDHHLDRGDPGDARLDADLDGHTNLQEYLAGTDPNNRSSCLRLTLSLSSGQAKLEFQAIANRSYAVEISDSPNNTSWRTMIETAPGLVNRSAIILDPGLTGTRFYRVVTPGPGQ